MGSVFHLVYMTRRLNHIRARSGVANAGSWAELAEEETCRLKAATPWHVHDEAEAELPCKTNILRS